MLDLCKHINDVENFQVDIMTFFLNNFAGIFREDEINVKIFLSVLSGKINKP